MKNYNLNLADGSAFHFQTIDAIIDGQVKEIVLAKNEFSLNAICSLSNESKKKITSSMILPTMVSVTQPEIFWNEGKKLYTWYGHEIPQGVDLGYPIYAYLDKTDNNNLMDMEGLPPFPVSIVNCDNTNEAITKMATSNALSRSTSKKDLLTYAGAKSELLNQVRLFAEKYKMQCTTAQGFFGISCSASMLQNAAIFETIDILDARSQETAELLFKAVLNAFGSRDAKQTRFIKAINRVVSNFGDIELVIDALNEITPDDKVFIDAEACEHKTDCIARVLTKYIMASVQTQTESATRQAVA